MQNIFDDAVNTERLSFKAENALLDQAKVEQVINKALKELKLAHHKLAVA